MRKDIKISSDGTTQYAVTCPICQGYGTIFVGPPDKSFKVPYDGLISLDVGCIACKGTGRLWRDE